MQAILDWLFNLLEDFGNAFSWLTTEVANINGFSFTPLILVSFGGLAVFIGIAVIKWVIS